MKIYSHLNLSGFSNCYVIVNEKIHEALIVDPGKITTSVIDTIEKGGHKLVGILVSHNHGSHVQGLASLRKIYTPKIYAADWEVAKNETNILKDDGVFKAADFDIEYFSIPGHTADSVVYKIGSVIFTGDCLFAGTIGSSNTKFSRRTLINNIKAKILSQSDETVIMPGHGPPTTVATERQFNAYLKDI